MEEAGECGRTRGTWVFARRLEVVAVVELLWLSWCVLGGADFFACFSMRLLFKFVHPEQSASTR